MTGFCDARPDGVSKQDSVGIDRSELLSWLESAIAMTPYGEVGISLVLHEGQVIRVRKTLEETRRIETHRDGGR
jgi:hypothetical protein